jgi:Leucine-rich repeat (LRR) protein
MLVLHMNESNNKEATNFNKNSSSINNKQDIKLYKNTYVNQKWIRLLEKDDSIPNGKKLAIRGNDLKLLDEDIFKIDLFLTSLELSPGHQATGLNIKLSKLSSNIKNLQHLREIVLDSNDLKQLPDELGNLENLERLVLSNNGLKTLPDSFSNLKKLESLHLAKNHFESIPQCVFELESLSFLDFTSNDLESLDRRLKNLCKTLRNLHVYDNLICELDGQLISSLVNLEEFWFGKNKIKVIPVEICKLKQLDWQDNYLTIIFEKNPIEKPPLNVCELGFSAIEKWYTMSNRA